MPRLSVIIPHRRDDKELEATVLSVLENRPSECEVIVVHDGSYADPYHLDDEVVFVETHADASVIEKVNAGVMAACSPVVNTILDGVTVSPKWSENALEIFASRPIIASVALLIDRGHARRSYGLDRSSTNDPHRLRKGCILRTTPTNSCAGPEITCGLFRRSVLLALDGFRHNEVSVAELDFCYALQQLKLNSHLDLHTVVSAPSPRHLSMNGLARFARLAVEIGVLSGGLAAALRELPTTCVSNPVTAWAWCMGIATGSRPPRNKRISRAKRLLAERKDQDLLRHFVSDRSRRAA